MGNKFINGLTQSTNFTTTENGAVTHKSTLNKVLDLFALGGAYRERSDEDCITLFKKALAENETLALKCLFYLRDCRKGQGERRFFRVVLNWLARENPDMVRRNLEFIPRLGRWDDLYSLVDTPVEQVAFRLMRDQIFLDLEAEAPSLAAKWAKSENSSSEETQRLGRKTRLAFCMSPKQYRKTLSKLRNRIRVVEKLMSEGRWDEIDFSKLPSKAGFNYRNAFATREETKAQYEAFAREKANKVNAQVLYPYDIAHQILCDINPNVPYFNANRLMIQKYWDNLPNYYGDRQENAIAIVDTSGSMLGRPMEAAISLGAYIAEKSKGPFAGCFITFSQQPQLVEFEGVDISDKIRKCYNNDNWGRNTNLESVFSLLLDTAIRTECSQDEIPKRLYILSDMEFDEGLSLKIDEVKTLIESIGEEWSKKGYRLPDVIFWNLNARNDNIPAIGRGFSYVSGLSPIIVETILSGKEGIDIMLEKLNQERYKGIH